MNFKLAIPLCILTLAGLALLMLHTGMFMHGD